MTIKATPAGMDQESWVGKKRRIALPAGSVAFIELDGAEPALILVHGFSDTSRSYSLLAPHLAGRRMVMPDLRNHGASCGDEPAGLTDYTADILALSEALDLRRPILVGHSLGGMVAIQACFERPTFFGGLVVLASSLMPKIGNSHPMVAGVSNLSDPIRPSDPFYEYWHHCKRGVPTPFLEKTAEEASEMPASRWRAILDMIRKLDLREQTSRLRDIETLIINGTDDELFDAGDREMFAAALPWARLLEIDGCGHNLHWEEPARVAAIVSARFPTNQPP